MKERREQPRPAISATTLLRRLTEAGGSDLHLCAGSPPILRVDGDLRPLPTPPLTAAEVEAVLAEVLTPEQRERLDSGGDLDFVREIPDAGRFRGNAFRQYHGASVVFRAVSTRIPTVEELGLPPLVRSLASLQRGLVLVTGPAGVGKSTTLASLIDLINQTRADHVITIEDPIEFIHTPKRALINHREVGRHTPTFAAALRAALREDPDVILVGELRDRETISIGLTAAETGHLVLGTLHTPSAPKTIDRIVDSFPPEQQAQARAMLAESLRAVVAQQLLRRKDGAGRVLAVEILLNTPAIANLIRDGKTFQIPTVMQTARKSGMVLMQQAVAGLLEAGVIAPEEARPHLGDAGGWGAGGTGIAAP